MRILRISSIVISIIIVIAAITIVKHRVDEVSSDIDVDIECNHDELFVRV